MLHGRFLVKQKKEIKTKKFLISSSQWLSPAVDLRLSTNRFIFHSGASQGKKNPSGWGVGPTNRPKGWLLIVHHQVGKERERGEEENQGPHRLFFFGPWFILSFHSSLFLFCLEDVDETLKWNALHRLRVTRFMAFQSTCMATLEAVCHETLPPVTFISKDGG